MRPCVLSFNPSLHDGIAVKRSADDDRIRDRDTPYASCYGQIIRIPRNDKNRAIPTLYSRGCCNHLWCVHRFFSVSGRRSSQSWFNPFSNFYIFAMSSKLPGDCSKTWRWLRIMDLTVLMQLLELQLDYIEEPIQGFAEIGIESYV